MLPGAPLGRCLRPPVLSACCQPSPARESTPCARQPAVSLFARLLHAKRGLQASGVSRETYQHNWGDVSRMHWRERAADDAASVAAAAGAAGLVDRGRDGAGAGAGCQTNNLARPPREVRFTRSEVVSAAKSLTCNDFAVAGRLLQPLARAIAPAAALLNHSCCGNCAVVSGLRPGGPPTLRVVVLRRVASGEELCHPYVPADTPVNQRREALLDRYGFACDCDLCQVQCKGAGEGADAAARLVEAGWPSTAWSATPAASGRSVEGLAAVLTALDSATSEAASESAAPRGLAPAAAAGLLAAVQTGRVGLVRSGGPAASEGGTSDGAALSEALAACAAAEAACGAKKDACGGWLGLELTNRRRLVVEEALAAGDLALALAAAALVAAREMCVLPLAHPSCVVRLAVLAGLCQAAGHESAGLAAATGALACTVFGPEHGLV